MARNTSPQAILILALAQATILLADAAPAQSKPTSAGDLRTENAAMQQRIRQLETEARTLLPPDGAAQKAAQQKDPNSRKQQAYESDFRAWALHKAVAKEKARGRKAEAGQFVWAEGIQLKAGARGGFAIIKRNEKPLLTLNPLLTGDYRRALIKLDSVRSRLDQARAAAYKRGVLDDLDRALLQVRGALWKQQQAAKKKTHAAQPLDGEPKRLARQPRILLLPPFGARQAKPRTAAELRQENTALRRRLADLQANRSDYCKALSPWAEARRRLQRTTEPVQARKVLDEMARILVNVRRVLWTLQRKQSKATSPPKATSRRQR